MKTTRAIAVLTLVTLGLLPAPATAGTSDDFAVVVKLIEQFYHVKHRSVPLLARAGLKGATTAARIRGGEYKRLAEAGSVRVVFFEDQDFNSRGGIAGFKTSITKALSETWSPLIQTLASKDEEQTYIFLKEAGAKYSLLVVAIDRRDAAVVQVKVKPSTLALLLQDPNGMGKAITDDVMKDDQE
jgi:hypothetical protein